MPSIHRLRHRSSPSRPAANARALLAGLALVAACTACDGLNPPPALTVAPNPVLVPAGGSGAATLRYVRGAGERTVSFQSANGVLVSAATATLRPGEETAVTVRVDPGVARGGYGVTVQGRSGADTQKAYFTVQVR